MDKRQEENDVSSMFIKRLSELLHRQIQIKLWYFLFLLFILYLAWESYWYSQVGLRFIKWHTHIMALFILWLIFAAVIRLFSRSKNLQLAIASVFVSLVVFEALLLVTGFTKTYMEKREGVYNTVKELKPNSILRNWPANNIHYVLPHNIRYTNQYGFSDAEFVKDTTKIIIQTYGDSFTEGDGAPADSSYPAILRNYLGDKYLVQNYGVCGNDPGYVIPQFEKIGASFKPQILILTYSLGDFGNDLLVRGGLKRFSDMENPTLLKQKWYEPIYAVSYISRLVFHAIGIEYNRYFLTKKEYLETLEKLKPEWNEIFEEIARLAKENNTKILLIKRPGDSEIEEGKYEYNMDFFNPFLEKHKEIYHVDLLSYYQSEMKVNKGGNIHSYFLVGDGHHNSKGYALMANGIYNALIETGLVTEEK